MQDMGLGDFNNIDHGTGNWRISLMEKPLEGFGHWDNIIVGGDTGHSYIVLKNPDGQIVSAIQGAAFTPITGQFEDGAQSVAGITGTIAHQVGLGDIFNKAANTFGYDLNVPLLRGTVQDGPDPFMHKESGLPLLEQPILEGSEAEMRRAFTSGMDALLDINAADLMYQGIGFGKGGLTFGVNCHSLSRAVMDAMGVERGMQPDFIYKSPGKDTNLYETVPGLTRHHPSNYADMDLFELRHRHGYQVAEVEDSLISDVLRQRVAERLGEYGPRETQVADASPYFAQG